MTQKTNEQIGWVVLVLCIVMGSMSCRRESCPSHDRDWYKYTKN